ncbi:MAG: ribonuclease P protein component [Burkholderiales bacterium]|nr:ribonuclease P protein component [Nitrosomonas sp.]MCP5243795.1 ribonuclease P protein component [Burkholderiales bacterium]MCP5292764.1 ribonuclease P protein component [Burkholderiales bacterium]
MVRKKYSLPRNRRLHHAKAFSAVFRYRHQVRGNYVQVYAKPNGLSFSRLGLIVSKKVERSAVKRNRIKRILRETFRTFQSCDNAVQMDWVMRQQLPISAEISRQLIAEIRLLMQQLQKCHDS